MAAGVEGVLVYLALRFSQAPGWRHLRWFAVIAASAALFSVCNLAFATPTLPDRWVVVAARLNGGFAVVHIVAWLYYTRSRLAQPVTRLDHWIVAGALAVGAVTLIPGVVVGPPVSAFTVEWANVRYRGPTPTALGSGVNVFLLLVFVRAWWPWVAEARARRPGARTHVAAFAVFFVLAANEVLISSWRLRSLYSVEIGFLVVVLAVVDDFSRRLADDARALHASTERLSVEVQTRTSELDETREALLRAERHTALGRLAASVGHEINNPLTSVLSNLQFIDAELETSASSEDIRAAVRDAESGTRRIADIVADLRVFSRTGTEPTGGSVVLRDVLETAIRLVGNEIRHHARIETNIDFEATVRGDASRLAQVFVNILSECARNVESAGADTSQMILNIAVLPGAAGTALVRFEHTGPTPGRVECATYFEPVFSKSATSVDSGFGLFVAQGIVRSLGGRMEARPREGGGTVIEVVLAIRAAAEREERVSARQLASRRRGLQILVIDDDDLVSRGMVRMLAEHDVTVARTVAAAREQLARESVAFDVVLCDIMLPDGSGPEIYASVEHDHPALAARFVFMTGGALTAHTRSFVEQHRNRTLSKPVDSHTLQSAISVALAATPTVLRRSSQE